MNLTLHAELDRIILLTCTGFEDDALRYDQKTHSDGTDGTF